jgi:hypothetical protein
MLAQAYAGRRFAAFSPAVIYQRVAETIAGTGLARYANLYQQIRDYQDTLRTFILDKDAEDPRSLHLLFDFDYAVEHWEAISKRPVDFGAVPKFQERDFRRAEILKTAIGDVGALILFNLILFAVSCLSFRQYDVR